MNIAGTALVVIEAVLIFGGVFGFCWWQLRSLKRDQAALARAKADAAAAEAKAKAETPPG